MFKASNGAGLNKLLNKKKFINVKLYFSRAIIKFSFLNVFSYITFRTGIAVFTSLFIVLIFGPIFINYLKKKSTHFNQPIRNDGLSLI